MGTESTAFNNYVYDPARASAGYVKLVRSIREQTGISLGEILDPHIIPARAGKVFDILARSGHGKTTFMSAIAKQHARKIVEAGRGGIVVYATWETPVEELEAFFQPKDGFDVSDLAWGRIDVGKVVSLTGERLNIPIWTIGTSLYGDSSKKPMTVDELFEAIVSIESLTGKTVEACFVDYVQAVHIQDERDRYNQVTKAARLMRQLSMQAKTPVILGVQANQRVDDVVGRYPTPRIRDAEWSSVITQDADTVISLWRPIKSFDPTIKPTLEIAGKTYNLDHNLLVVDLLKQRWAKGSGRYVMNLEPSTLEISARNDNVYEQSPESGKASLNHLLDTL